MKNFSQFKRRIFLFFITILTSLTATYQVLAADITVEQGYVRESIPGNTVTSSYMVINNLSSQSIKLVGATSNVSPRIEIHQHTMSDGMMKMGQVDGIEIGQGEQVILQPMGLHLMLFDLPKPLKDGEEIELNLIFDGQDELKVTLPVNSIKSKKPQHHHH